MAKWILDTLIRRTAAFAGIEEDLFADGDTKAGEYLIDTDAVKLKNKIIDYINECMDKVCREKYILFTKETVTDLDTSGLTYTFLAVKDIKNEYNRKLEYEEGADGYLIVPEQEDGETLTLSYYYAPKEITAITQAILIPDGKVDPKIYCHYAAYQVLVHESDSDSQNKAITELSLFNDMYSKIASVESSFTTEEVW